MEYSDFIPSNRFESIMREIIHSPVVFAESTAIVSANSDRESSSVESIMEPNWQAMPTPADFLWREQLLAILLQERSYGIPIELCRFDVANDNDSESRLCDPPYQEWRTKICQWSFKVIDHFGMDREVVSVAINLLDRFLLKCDRTSHSDESSVFCSCSCCGGQGVDSRTFQLAAMTSLYVAFKVQNGSRGVNDDKPVDIVSPFVLPTIRRRKLNLTSFIELSRGQFCAVDILDMERLLLATLEWKVHPPTPMTVVSLLLKLLPRPLIYHNNYDLVLHVLQELARYLTELSVCLATTAYSSASHVAYASILVGMDMLTYPALPMAVRDEFNEAVVRLSNESLGGTILTPNDEPIRQLQEMMNQAFWPELLLEDVNEKEHPLLMAREHGMLVIGHRQQRNRRERRLERKPARKRSVTSVFEEQYDPKLEISPVSVSR